MKEDPFVGVYRALSPKELAEMFMNPHAPKTEAEHWAVREIEKLRAEVERLRAALRWYADHRNHFPVLHHRRAGDPDPVAVFVEEPPIMSDGGRRAREALEAKP